MELLLITISILAIIQSLFNIYSMIYAWDNVENIEKLKAPQTFEEPKFSFTILLPAWKEEDVIGQTLQTLARINYPYELTEILVLLRIQDQSTIDIVNKTIKYLPNKNIRTIIVNDLPRNKPNQLNWGLKEAKGDLTVIFDAEDEVNKNILNIANTEFLRKDHDVLQCGVQLMNYNSKWFSFLNVLEYYFWFKSSLLLFSKCNMIPLGGNSAFIKTKLLKEHGGWDENCLTEDCELGIRFGASDLKISVLYDPNHSTKEETPITLDQFVKQRTRWLQGFIEIFFKGEWLKMNNWKKIIASFYLLSWPFLQSILFIYFLISICILPFIKLSLLTGLITLLPLLLLFLQLLYLNIGLFYFTKEYLIKYNHLTFFKLFLSFVPYQAILTYSCFRAILRSIFSKKEWEKTAHFNSHRIPITK
jgi:glycosyltransferase XagB